MQFGVDNEAAGAARYLELIKMGEQFSGSTLCLQEVGLIIPLDTSFLAASPTGL